MTGQNYSRWHLGSALCVREGKNIATADRNLRAKHGAGSLVGARTGAQQSLPGKVWSSGLNVIPKGNFVVKHYSSILGRKQAALPVLWHVKPADPPGPRFLLARSGRYAASFLQHFDAEPCTPTAFTDRCFSLEYARSRHLIRQRAA